MYNVLSPFAEPSFVQEGMPYLFVSFDEVKNESLLSTDGVSKVS
jgi:hypothetical protein